MSTGRRCSWSPATLFAAVLFKPVRISPLYNALVHVTGSTGPYQSEPVELPAAIGNTNQMPNAAGWRAHLEAEGALSAAVGIRVQPPADVTVIPPSGTVQGRLKAGIARVHLVDGRVEHSLVLELFTPEGVGTMITPDAGPTIEGASG